MWRHWTVALFAAGCGFQATSQGTSLDGPPMIDAPGTMACPWPYTPSGFDPCAGVPTEMLPDLDLQDPDVFVYDTDDGILQDPAGTETTPPSTVVGGARVMWTREFRIRAGATLRVKGDSPFVLVSQSDVTVEGTIDVGSHLLGNDRVGAGSNPPVCATAALFGTQCTHGGSGGGGGGFGTAGAQGGIGGLTHDCGAGAAAGIPGGPGGAATADVTFRGGCDGGDGANGDGELGGDGGDGGGAIHIVARNVLRVGAAGKVLAGGGGGTGGNNGRSGGGGGGSGGLILLAGTTIAMDAGGVIAANGAGGGGGANGNQAGGGADGQPALAVAMGGAPEGSSGFGGNGAFGGMTATMGTGLDRGGGGGGGGAGKIVLITKAGNAPVTTGAVISPAPF